MDHIESFFVIMLDVWIFDHFVALDVFCFQTSIAISFEFITFGASPRSFAIRVYGTLAKFKAITYHFVGCIARRLNDMCKCRIFYWKRRRKRSSLQPGNSKSGILGNNWWIFLDIRKILEFHSSMNMIGCLVWFFIWRIHIFLSSNMLFEDIFQFINKFDASDHQWSCLTLIFLIIS